jgi:hypothetical protein
MSQGWKITIIVLAVAGVASAPVIWLLNSTDAEQLAGASIQAAAGVAALVWALLQHPGSLADDMVVRTDGYARAVGERP